MKGYSEERGLSFKLDFDAESKQFVSKPVAHAFVSHAERVMVLQKLAEPGKRRKAKKIGRKLRRLLAGVNPVIHDDIGMSDVFAASHQL